VTCDSLKAKAQEHKLVLAYFGDVSAKEYKSFLDVAANSAVSEKF
jgi:hypothetical protein